MLDLYLVLYGHPRIWMCKIRAKVNYILCGCVVKSMCIHKYVASRID